MSDYPRAELMRRADIAIHDAGGPNIAKVFFKFTCFKCGERCTFNQPNMLFERGVCCSCGTDQPVAEGGFALEMTI